MVKLRRQLVVQPATEFILFQKYVEAFSSLCSPCYYSLLLEDKCLYLHWFDSKKVFIQNSCVIAILPVSSHKNNEYRVI
jgi:hypothetical protein